MKSLRLAVAALFSAVTAAPAAPTPGKPTTEPLQQRTFVCRAFSDATELLRREPDAVFLKSLTDQGRCRWIAGGVRVSLETAYRGLSCLRIAREARCLWGVLDPPDQARRLGISQWRDREASQPNWRPPQAQD